MSTLSIKVNIAGRDYPLTIKREEEEDIRRAAKKINSRIDELGGNYAVKDKQDLLAMTCLQYATQIQEGIKGTGADDALLEKLQELDEVLGGYLQDA